MELRYDEVLSITFAFETCHTDPLSILANRRRRHWKSRLAIYHHRGGILCRRIDLRSSDITCYYRLLTICVRLLLNNPIDHRDLIRVATYKSRLIVWLEIRQKTVCLLM